ncbi:hypothetical protein GBAR_LOCUS1990, partial [Geodia barretti]
MFRAESQGGPDPLAEEGLRQSEVRSSVMAAACGCSGPPCRGKQPCPRPHHRSQSQCNSTSSPQLSARPDTF